MTCRRLTPRPLSRRCSARRPRLEIHVTDATPILLHSRIFAERGIPHAFTTRRGGVSRGVFESLNFGNPGDLPTASRDPAANIHANFGIVLGEIGCVGREVVQVHQIHGNALHRVRAGRSAHETLSDTKADGLIDRGGRTLIVPGATQANPVFPLEPSIPTTTARPHSHPSRRRSSSRGGAPGQKSKVARCTPRPDRSPAARTKTRTGDRESRYGNASWSYLRRARIILREQTVGPPTDDDARGEL